MTFLVVVSVVAVVKKKYGEIGKSEKTTQRGTSGDEEEPVGKQRQASVSRDKLVMEKQNLLHAQWTLDEKKKNCDREILNRDKLVDLTKGVFC